MNVFPRLFVIASLGLVLAGCKTDHHDDGGILPTPSPSPSPTASPAPEPTATPGESLSGGDSTTPVVEVSAPVAAAMPGPTEAVVVIDVDRADRRDSTVLLIERANAEQWRFEIAGRPDLRSGDTIIYENAFSTFGDPFSGQVIAPFPGGDRYRLSAASQIR